MKTFYLIIISILFTSCHVSKHQPKTLNLAFGSCTNQAKSNQMWQEIIDENPDAFIFTGDAVYPEIYNLESLEKAYQNQIKDDVYQKLKDKTQIYGVYDDHDYGLNDGGKYNPIKSEAKNLFIDYIIDKKITKKYHLKDNQNGLFYALDYPNFDTKVIVLDTRYNRTDLKKSTNPQKRYETVKEGEVLGNAQWKFLNEEIANTPLKRIILISSIQVLNTSHHYEKWGNIINERQRLLNLIADYNDKRFIIISGDRHFSEVSKYQDIIEVTSSGLTEVATMANESNSLRISKMYKEPNFGMLRVTENQIEIELIGNKGVLYHYTID